MATSRLKIYNGALLICGERQLASVDEDVEGRRLLDNVWNDGGVDYCLEQGQWRFAMRTQRLDYTPAIDPNFGYRRAFEKPADWLLTSAICQDEYYQTPLLQMTDEAGILYADLDELYVKFISNDAGYGTNYALWPATFTEYVKHYFAGKIVYKLTADESRREYLLGPSGRPDRGQVNATLLAARNRDAINEPTRFPARGSWTQARTARRNLSDGGSTTRLIG